MRLLQHHKTAAAGIHSREPDLKSAPKNAEKLLFDAAAKGGANEARTAILHHADVDARNYKNETPLMVTSGACYVGVVNTLIKFRADPFALDTDGLTARGRLKNVRSHMNIVRALKKYVIVRALKAYEKNWTREHAEPELFHSD